MVGYTVCRYRTGNLGVERADGGIKGVRDGFLKGFSFVRVLVLNDNEKCMSPYL